MLKAEERLLSYSWSSFATSRAQFEQWMERRRLEETDPEALEVLRQE